MPNRSATTKISTNKSLVKFAPRDTNPATGTRVWADLKMLATVQTINDDYTVQSGLHEVETSLDSPCFVNYVRQVMASFLCS